MKVIFNILLIMLISTCFVTAQNVSVTGTVTYAEDGEPVIGATVSVKGTSIGVATDIEGKFKLNIPSSAKILTFSYIGMETKDLAVKKVMDVKMQTSSEQLEEVMVVAYGTAKKSSFTGSAAVVKEEDLMKRQTSNITQALAGQVAGVQVQSSNGQPGSDATIRIRGIGSMAADNKPLYVVDGVPFDGELSSINSSDIASMTVLKDAASNALYGARGANGVILINTKRGKNGVAKISFDAKLGTNRRGVPNYDVLESPATYYEMSYAALRNSKFDGNNAEAAHTYALKNICSNENGGLGYQVYTAPTGQDFIGTDGKLNPNATLGYSDGEFYYQPDNWYDELFDTGNMRQEYNFSISGSKDKFDYYLSAGYLDDSGIIAGSGFERFSTRLNADYQAKKWLKVGGNFTYVNSNSQIPNIDAEKGGSSSANIFYVANYMAPIYPFYARTPDKNIMVDKMGYTVYDYGNTTNFKRSFMNQSNPASMVELDKRNFQNDIIGIRGYADINFTKDFSFRVNLGLDNKNTRFNHMYNPFYGQMAQMGGIVVVKHTRTNSVNQQYLFNYNKTFNDAHTLEALAGYEDYSYSYQYLYGSKEKIYNPDNSEIDNGILNPSTSSYENTYATQSFLGRVQYNYINTYHLTASFRRDASSRFHPDNRWGNFWSVGGAWSMSNESFLANATWIDFLKYKMSYGVQGNDALLDNLGDANYYPYMDQYKISNSNGEFATSLSYKGNPDITWETSHSFNMGFDFSFLAERVSGSVEYFRRKTTDLLYYMPVPGSNGYSAYPKNIGSLNNAGVEFGLTGKLVDTKDVTLFVNVNGTHFKNKVLELSPELNGQLIEGNRIYKEGESMYQYYIREYAGVNTKTGAAQWYKIDKDTGVQTVTENWSEATRVETGDMLPKLYGGFGTNAQIYGFDVSVQFTYQLGGEIYDLGYATLMHSGDASSAGKNWHKDALGAWNANNKSSNIPVLNSIAKDQNSTSDRFMISSNYLNIQNITIGYTLPTELLQKAKIGSTRIYFVADNVALFSKRKGLDPRQSFTSASAAYYSPIRSISGGISLTF